VRPGSRTKVSVPLVLPQTRHPERSALTDLSRDTALVARSRRNPGGACLTHAARSFSTAEAAPGGFFPWAWKMITLHERCTRDHPVRIAADPVVGLQWSKSSEQHG
jgi:hypothetical protein